MPPDLSRIAPVAGGELNRHHSHDGAGGEFARMSLAIPCSGSRLWSYHEVFDAASRARAGAGGYITIRDTILPSLRLSRSRGRQRCLQSSTTCSALARTFSLHTQKNDIIRESGAGVARMPESHHSKVLIIGSGPAGYTASIYAARAICSLSSLPGYSLAGR